MALKNGKIVAGPTQYAGATALPAGMIAPFALTAAPSGWLVCDGSAVSRTTYAGLFGLMGTIHGTGDGSTTFNLPDYRGQFLRGYDPTATKDVDAASRTAMNTGGATGNNVGAVQSDGLASHTHTVTTGRWYVFSSGSQTAWSNLSGSVPFSSDATGGNETRPKNALVLYCVKT